jgi:hypothetical protein
MATTQQTPLSFPLAATFATVSKGLLAIVNCHQAFYDSVSAVGCQNLAVAVYSSVFGGSGRQAALHGVRKGHSQHSSAAISGVRNSWSCTSTLLWVFML